SRPRSTARPMHSRSPRGSSTRRCTARAARRASPGWHRREFSMRRISWMTSTRSKTSNGYAADWARRPAGCSPACTWAPPHEALSYQSPRMKVTVLSGGVGGARFLRGMSVVAEIDNMTIIGNVADDIEVLGLHVSPDLDSVLYGLAGLADDER